MAAHRVLCHAVTCSQPTQLCLVNLSLLQGYTYIDIGTAICLMQDTAPGVDLLMGAAVLGVHWSWRKPAAGKCLAGLVACLNMLRGNPAVQDLQGCT